MSRASRGITAPKSSNYNQKIAAPPSWSWANHSLPWAGRGCRRLISFGCSSSSRLSPSWASGPAAPWHHLFFRDQRVLFPIFPLGCFEMTDNSTSLLSKEYNFVFLPLSQGSIPSAFLSSNRLLLSSHSANIPKSHNRQKCLSLHYVPDWTAWGLSGMESRTGIFISAGHPVGTSPRISEAEAIVIPILHVGKLRHWKLRNLLSHT